MAARPERSDGLPPAPGRLFWPSMALGGVIMACGLWGLLSDSARTRPVESLRFVIGAAVIHDLLLAPVVVVLGVAVAGVVPPRARGPVQAALVVSGAVVLFSVPFVRGYGRVSTNPSILPRNYAEGLWLVLAAVWAATIAVVVRRGLLERRSPGGGDGRDQTS